METKPDTRRWKTVPVTDLDIVYVGGVHDTITYGTNDSVSEDEQGITVIVRDIKTSRTTERLVCLWRNMLSYKYRDRLLKVEDKTPLPVEVVDVPTDD